MVVRENLDDRIERSIASNGLTILTERLPGLRSAAIGVWVRAASGHEQLGEMGIAHCIEHMVFKGTESRSARELAQALEVRGGSLDAFTGRDATAYQAHVLDQDLPLAVDILTDLVRRPLFREEDLTLEKNVILEEIKSVLDTPDDFVFEVLSSALWPDHPYGYSILGTPETIGSLTRERLKTWHGGAYYPGNCVIAAAGNLDHDQILDELGKHGWLDGDIKPPMPAVAPTPAARGIGRFVVRDSAQRHVVFATDTFAAADPRRYAMAIVTNIFGGGMSSRLFQRVREELGLAYAVYAFQQSYRATGLLGVYVGTQPDTADQAKTAIREEFLALVRDGLSEEEWVGGKQQLKGQLMLALENPGSRMHRLAGFTLNDDRYRRLEDILAEIDAVSQDDIRTVIEEFYDPARFTVVELGGETTNA